MVTEQAQSISGDEKSGHTRLANPGNTSLKNAFLADVHQ
jgi:hypothetical protein